LEAEGSRFDPKLLRMENFPETSLNIP